jgi:hypothetical protein
MGDRVEDLPDAAPGDAAKPRTWLPRLEAEDRRRLRSVLKPVLVIAISLVVGWLIVGFVGAVDWGQVVNAFALLSPWQFVPLVALLLVRQVLNAIPLSQFVSGLSVRRSVQNDVAANLAGTIAPPPGDVVVRIAMFNSWGINPLDGMAGVTLNMITFYSVRFIAPVIGLVFLAIVGAEGGNPLLSAALALLSIAILAALLLLLRGDRWAVLVGSTAARVARRFKADIDAKQWADAVVDFRGRMTADLPPRLAKSIVALLGMIAADATILAVAIRFTGIGADRLPLVVILGTFLTAYPLTVMPLFGLGVLDAALLAAFTDAAGLSAEANFIAGLSIWRATTILGTLVLGAGMTLYWRRQSRRQAVAD